MRTGRNSQCKLLGSPRQSRSLGYAHWPEQDGCGATHHMSLDHWDMRTGRNWGALLVHIERSLDHWDMRTGRNWQMWRA